MTALSTTDMPLHARPMPTSTPLPMPKTSSECATLISQTPAT